MDLNNSKLLVSLGICAYNEEKNIGCLLDSLFNQNLAKIGIGEIIIISDGSNDQTCLIIEKFTKDKKIKLIKQENRLGKWAAINKFFEVAAFPILVLASADIILENNAIEKLCEQFLCTENLGIVCGRSFPKNSINNFFGYVANLQGYLHHRLSLIQPKFNELIAFRNNIKYLPPTLVDEEHIALIIKNNNYLLRYIPEAFFWNKGPENLSDFFMQRKRIYCGHLILKKAYNYEVSTFNSIKILKHLFKGLSLEYRKNILWLLAAVLLEAVVRIKSIYDIYFNNCTPDYKWKIARSTKDLRDV